MRTVVPQRKQAQITQKMSEDTRSISGVSETLTSTESTARSTLSKQRSRTSWVWQHMEGGPDAVLLVNGELCWRCLYCLVSYKHSGGTRSIAAHLTKAHNKRDTKVQQHEVVKGRIEAAFARAATNPYKRKRVITDNGYAQIFESAVFEELLIEWIAVDSIAFKKCESPQFKALLKYLNCHVESCLPTRNTVKNWSLQQYQTRRTDLQDELAAVTQKIHLSIDIWTGEGVAYIGIIAHYFDQYNQQKAPVLVFRELIGPHTGENQATYVTNALVEFDIINKLGYVMLDNASNNDTLMKHLSQSTFI